MRMIDAGLLLNNLSGMLASMKDYDTVLDVVNNMPAAYDADKVVEQLEEKALEHAINGQQFGEDGLYLEEEEEQKIKEIIEECIEVVKAGGIDE